MDMFTKTMALELGPYKVSDGQGWLVLREKKHDMKLPVLGLKQAFVYSYFNFHNSEPCFRHFTAK